jgi:uncharacterized phage-associated protein
MAIRFRMNERKALEAVVWLLNQKPGMTRYNLAKILYYADKWHLEEYGRPITGDRYIAMQEGMVPSQILDMLERDGRTLQPEDIEIILEAIERYQNDERYEAYRPRRDPEVEYLSRSDIECLRRALDAYGNLSFQDLRDLAHHDPAWKSAWDEKHNSEMDYEDIIGVDHPKRDQLIERLRETSGRLVF